MFKLKYDNEILDDVIEGYTTINIEGRGLFAPKINTTNIEGRDGEFIINEQLPARTLRIHFAIKAKNNEERNNIIRKLNQKLIKRKDVKVELTDQEGYYIGRFSSFSDIPYDYFQGVGSFEIYCQKPYLYMDIKEKTGNNINIELDDVTFIEFVSVELDVLNTKEIKILNKNNGDVICLKDLENVGKLIITKEDIKLDGINIKNKLDINTSVWKKFRIFNKDIITIIGGENCILKYRGLII